ncbi:(2Fe-2S) ferredoxin domain-containing protein [Romboutsia sp.]|uniref:(2Fe-2S) ferredoxin domain-containing protein n=1 Tax=Romboutsia sp. TaxID=1965302 RepID=UPI003F347047
MKSVSICIGSSCYIKGSHYVVEIFKELIEEYNLKNEIELYASFCLEKCTEGVCVKRWDDKILSASKDNARLIFEKEILPYI